MAGDSLEPVTVSEIKEGKQAAATIDATQYFDIPSPKIAPITDDSSIIGSVTPADTGWNNNAFSNPTTNPFADPAEARRLDQIVAANAAREAKRLGLPEGTNPDDVAAVARLEKQFGDAQQALLQVDSISDLMSGSQADLARYRAASASLSRAKEAVTVGLPANSTADAITERKAEIKATAEAQRLGIPIGLSIEDVNYVRELESRRDLDQARLAASQRRDSYRTEWTEQMLPEDHSSNWGISEETVEHSRSELDRALTAARNGLSPRASWSEVRTRLDQQRNSEHSSPSTRTDGSSRIDDGDGSEKSKHETPESFRRRDSQLARSKGIFETVSTTFV